MKKKTNKELVEGEKHYCKKCRKYFILSRRSNLTGELYQTCSKCVDVRMGISHSKKPREVDIEYHSALTSLDTADDISNHLFRYYGVLY